MNPRHILMSALLLGSAPAGTAAQAVQLPAVDTLAIRAHTRFLADDQLAGRGTGTAGERLAAAYIVSQLERIGLRPAGETFLQPIPLRAARIDPQSRVSVMMGADSTAFAHGADFIVNTGGQGTFRDFRGRGVFFGQPVHAADLVENERSLVGRVAVFLGPLGADAVTIIPALGHAGAAGVIILVPDSTQYQLYVRSRGDTRYFVDAAVDDPVWQPALPVLIAGPTLTDRLMRDVAVPPALMQGEASEPLDLGVTIAARVRATQRDVPAANIAAVLPGTDPFRRDEYVAYTAHYDHLGISTPDASGDSIYNGFSDNAAGVAMLLAIAEAMKKDPPARSVAFLFFTGEERGLLGASWMAASPPIPLDRVTALVNLDAGAPPAAPVSWRIAGGQSPLGETARTIGQAAGWTVALGAASPNSDYWPFLQRGVPSIFIIPGDQWENVTPDERDALRRRWDRYHRADDHWAADFPFSGLGRYAAFALMLGQEMARR